MADPMLSQADGSAHAEAELDDIHALAAELRVVEQLCPDAALMRAIALHDGLDEYAGDWDAYVAFKSQLKALLAKPTPRDVLVTQSGE